MLDRSRAHGPSARDLKPAPDDASTAHYWLMRRPLGQPLDVPELPGTLRRSDLCAANAQAVHQLLVLGQAQGGGRVLDFSQWLDAFDLDPECDRQLCFVLEDALGIVAVAHCWTSAFIRNLVVHPRARQRGIGHSLLGVVFAAFAQRREGHVDLKVMESNLAARRLYERVGMQYVQRKLQRSMTLIRKSCSGRSS